MAFDSDILVKGAKPLFFLNYYAADIINPKGLLNYVKGISLSCQEVDCALLGGETAEMPNIYCDDKSDMVGTIIGIVSKDNIIDGPKNIVEGDIVFGIPSDGPHTNGYSLIRKIVNNSKERIKNNVMKLLQSNHRCYYNEINLLWNVGVDIHGMVHITGGGYSGNIKRVINNNLVVSLNKWDLPEPFKTLQIEGNINSDEMFNTFNCGYGMLIFIKKEQLELVKNTLKEGDVLGVVNKKNKYNNNKVVFV